MYRACGSIPDSTIELGFRLVPLVCVKKAPLREDDLQPVSPTNQWPESQPPLYAVGAFGGHHLADLSLSHTSAGRWQSLANMLTFMLGFIGRR